jgi:hypothetical protein
MDNLRIKNGHKENASATDPGAGGDAKLEPSFAL